MNLGKLFKGLQGLRNSVFVLRDLEEFGSELWAGWPFAFLSFEVPLPQSSHLASFDQNSLGKLRQLYWYSLKTLEHCLEACRSTPSVWYKCKMFSCLEQLR